MPYNTTKNYECSTMYLQYRKSESETESADENNDDEGNSSYDEDEFEANVMPQRADSLLTL